MKKYELTTTSKMVFGRTGNRKLLQIKELVSFGDNLHAKAYCAAIELARACIAAENKEDKQ